MCATVCGAEVGRRRRRMVPWVVSRVSRVATMMCVELYFAVRERRREKV